MTILTVFIQMLSLLVMIAAGWIAARTKMLDTHTNSHMSQLIVNIFNPLLVAIVVVAAGSVQRGGFRGPSPPVPAADGLSHRHRHVPVLHPGGLPPVSLF